LEALASAPAIAARAREKLQKGFESLMLDLAGGDPAAISAEVVSRACAENDPVALRVFEETGRYLGIGAANLINVLNPELVLFGGGGAQAGEFLLAPIQKEVDRRSFSGSRCRAELGLCALGNDAGVVGAARVAMDANP
jgi:glucokinase